MLFICLFRIHWIFGPTTLKLKECVWSSGLKHVDWFPAVVLFFRLLREAANNRKCDYWWFWLICSCFSCSSDFTSHQARTVMFASALQSATACLTNWKQSDSKEYHSEGDLLRGNWRNILCDREKVAESLCACACARVLASVWPGPHLALKGTAVNTSGEASQDPLRTPWEPGVRDNLQRFSDIRSSEYSISISIPRLCSLICHVAVSFAFLWICVRYAKSQTVFIL